MANTNLTMVGLGSMVLGVVLIIVLYGVVPMIGEQIDTAVTLPTATQATVTLSFTGIVNGSNNTAAVVGSETYTFTNGTAGAFYVDVGTHDANASYSCTQFTTEVNVNSTIVTAGTCASNATLLTAIVTTSAGNGYVSTDNITNAAFSGTTFTGGVTGTQWDSATNTGIPTGPTFWATLSGFITLTALMLFVAGFIGVLRGIRS